MANHAVHAEAAELNDMIGPVWFVSWFCGTEKFGCASPSAFFGGFHVSIFILEHFNLKMVY